MLPLIGTSTGTPYRHCHYHVTACLPWILLLLLPISLFGQNAQDLLDTQPPKRLVSDYSDILSPEEEAYLEDLLLDYADTTSTQIAIVTVETTGGDNINLITAEIAAHWKIGQQGKDNGCLILVASGDREISIQKIFRML